MAYCRTLAVYSVLASSCFAVFVPICVRFSICMHCLRHANAHYGSENAVAYDTNCFMDAQASVLCRCCSEDKKLCNAFDNTESAHARALGMKESEDNKRVSLWVLASWESLYHTANSTI
ncbi:hypothetical protein BDV25DRAFT_123320 [Aspergillus avenaceus]|uniref:Uncharacterized protein n=1 Tax=Aspergillus avenaceus TaxID=36643 RepID=A0A5N6TTK6_ASPAV|nr:hypothetical protein BDV25DRAFT_123320 [Aspergillus avenaceus]